YACTSPTYKNVVTDGLQTAGAAASRPGGRSEFEHSRADVIEMNRRRLALGNDSVPANLDGLLTIDRTLPRVAALKVLQEDDRLLASLVAITLPAEVGAANGSLRKVPGVSVSVMDASTIGGVAGAGLPRSWWNPALGPAGADTPSALGRPAIVTTEAS